MTDVTKLFSTIDKAFRRTYGAILGDLNAVPTCKLANIQSDNIDSNKKMTIEIPLGSQQNCTDETIVSEMIKAFDRILNSNAHSQGISIDRNPSDVLAINLDLSENFKIKSINKWTLTEEEPFIKEVVDVYVVKKANDSIQKFLKDHDFTDLIYAHGLESVKLKLQNTKAVFEEKQLNDSLDVKPLKRYSAQNKNLVEKYVTKQKS